MKAIKKSIRARRTTRRTTRSMRAPQVPEPSDVPEIVFIDASEDGECWCPLCELAEQLGSQEGASS